MSQVYSRAATWKRFEDDSVYKMQKHKVYTKLIKSSIGGQLLFWALSPDSHLLGRFPSEYEKWFLTKKAY